MAHALKNWVRKRSALLNGSASSSTQTAAQNELFTKVNPAVDGDDCEHDCASCTIRYPAKFSIDEDSHLYGEIKGWSTHLIVATGKTDWVRDVADEKDSVMEGIDRSHVKPANGRIMLSASNIPIPDYAHDRDDYGKGETPTSVLLLPAFTIVDHVTPNSAPDLIRHIISSAPTTTSPLPPLPGKLSPSPPGSSSGVAQADGANGGSANGNDNNEAEAEAEAQVEAELGPTTLPPDLPFRTRPCPHDVLILMCSHKTRDARCGQSAPLLKKEFERHLRPLGLYRDAHDERPGGVGIYFINHVGGHKFSANVMIYRRAGMGSKGVVEGGSAVMTQNGGISKPASASATANSSSAAAAEATQCIWLARVRPADCEGIVRFTVLQGKVVHPDRQLRGGFNRERGLTSW